MIIFARHGETDANKRNLFNGETDHALNEVGLLQARKLAQKLADRKFAKVYCSDKLRAIQTAEIITGGKEFAIDERITELRCGKFDGRRKNIFSVMRFVRAVKRGARGAERFDLFLARNIDFFENILKPGQKSGEDILVVSHEGNAKALDFYLKGKPKGYRFSKRLIENGGILVFEC